MRTLVALGILVWLAGCSSSPATPVVTPPVTAQPAERDVLGMIQPRPYEPQKIEHDARAAELVAAGEYQGCGQHYLARYDARPEAADADQVLFNGAACLAQARSIGAAQRLRTMLVSKHPDSRFVPDTLLATARTWSEIASFGEAAAAYEAYAAGFKGRADAPGALLLALRYRLATDDTDRALDDARSFARNYGASLPDQAAEIDLLVNTVYLRRGDTPGLIAHLDRFEQRYQDNTRLGLRIAAMVARGRARWHQACPVAAIERGVCARIDPAPPKPACGPASRKLLWRVAARDTKLSASARADFRNAIALWDAARLDQRDLGGSYWAAAAQFYLGEHDLEQYLRLTLDLSGSQTMMQKQFTQFLAEIRTLHGQMQTAYRKVLRYDDGALYWGVAAQARLAQGHLRFVDLLLSTEIPAFIRESEYAEDMLDAYCDQLTEAAEPIGERAKEILEACTRLATAAGWYDVWTRWCQDELSREWPQSLPPVREWFGDADRIGGAPAGARDRSALEQRIAADPRAIDTRLALARAILDELPRQADAPRRAAEVAVARTHLASVLAMDPDDATAAVLLAMVLLAADAESDAGRQLARLVIDQARVRNPDSAEVINAEGIVAARRGQLGLAYSLFREAQLVASDFLPTHLNAGSAALRLRKLEEAVAHFEAAVSLAPADYEAQLGLGVALRTRGDLPGAERAYRAALALAPARPDAAFDLGILYRDFRSQETADLGASLVAFQTAETWFLHAIGAPALRPEQRELVQRELDDTARSLRHLRDLVKAMPRPP
ncbi:MAG TPA: tetratricopeptide repeat protein [Kofleriaceae bacterium]|nr:tetratricopeptide repeat protein [Kofleriaceae bacterium]